jgi:hypothetical protein
LTATSQLLPWLPFAGLPFPLLPRARLTFALLTIARLLLVGLWVAGLRITGLLSFAALAIRAFSRLTIRSPLCSRPTFAPLALSPLTLPPFTLARLTFARLTFRSLLLARLISFTALLSGAALARLLLTAPRTLTGLLAIFWLLAALSTPVLRAGSLLVRLCLLIAWLAAVARIPFDFAVELVGELPQLVAGPPQGFSFVAEHRFGGPLDPFPQLADSATGVLFLLARVVRQPAPHRLRRRLQGPVGILVLGVARGVIQPFRQERLCLFGLLNRLPHLLGEIGQALSLVSQVLLDPFALAVVAERFVGRVGIGDLLDPLARELGQVRLGDAGLGTVNLAVDCVDEKPGLAKALAPIRPHFEYLLKNMRRYNYSVFLNVCITRTNMDDVRQLTELAHDYDIGIDYHIVESPMLDAPHFKHLDENSTFLTPLDYPRVDELIDWIVEKHKQGYKIVNQRERIIQMKQFLRGQIEPWGCRAGQNTIIVRVDGTLAPCFPLYSATYDWGVAGKPKFDAKQLTEMKKECELHCFSTLNHIVSYVYNNGRVIKWIINQYRKNRWTEASGTVE